MRRLSVCLLFVFGVVEMAYASGPSAIFNFNDPVRDPELELFGRSSWQIDEQSGNRFLSIADGNEPGRGVVVFSDFFEGDALEAGFRLSTRIRLGGSDAPGGGMSLSLVPPEDPLLTDPLGERWAAFPAGVPTLVEGTRKGLSIGLDERQDETAGGQPECSSLESDCVGVSVRVDGHLINETAYPAFNGSLVDEDSLQTNAEHGELGWAELLVVGAADCFDRSMVTLSIFYKGRNVFNGTSPFRLTPIQLVLAAEPLDTESTYAIDDFSLFTGQTSCRLGDFNEDGLTDLADFAILAQNMNKVSDAEFNPIEGFKLGDLDRNGRITIGDFALFRRQYQSLNAVQITVPEPSGRWVLCLTLLWGSARRRDLASLTKGAGRYI